MSKVQRPHLAWTAAVLAAVALLSATAWWLWSRPNSSPGSSPSSTGGEVSASGPSAEVSEPTQADELQAALSLASAAIERDRFSEAAEALARAEKEFGWSAEVGEVITSLSLREASYRESLRPIEFRIEGLVMAAPDEEADDLYARYSIEGVPVFASELLELTTAHGPVGAGQLPSRSHIAVLRTSFAIGASLEIVQPGGIFDSEDVVFGPVPLSPLPITEGGYLEFVDADARVRSVVVSYRTSPFDEGVTIDARMPPPPADATATQLVDAVTAAIGRDDLVAADVIQARLSTEFPSHPDASFIAKRITDRREYLRQNHTSATFTILELSVDPRPSGETGTKLWASGGDAPAFRSSIRTTDGLVLAAPEDARTAPYLITGSADPAPTGNVLHVVARGAAPLDLVVKDSAPRFSSRVVGTIDLPITLSELPRGSGTIVVERNPRVLIQPNSEPNRIRRVVLRWTVTR